VGPLGAATHGANLVPSLKCNTLGIDRKRLLLDLVVSYMIPLS
jgi:hypothetical protein